MHLIRRSLHALHQEPALELSGVATIGNFDGVHLGHQMVIKTVLKIAQQEKLMSRLITFEPSPQEFFSPATVSAADRLMSFQEKFETIQALGVDEMCVLHFNLELASLPAEEFVQTMLVQNLKVKHVVVGSDFRFGKGRLGTVETLEECGKKYGFLVTAVPLLQKNGEIITSSRIRAALMQNRQEEAEDLLGRKVH